MQPCLPLSSPGRLDDRWHLPKVPRPVTATCSLVSVMGQVLVWVFGEDEDHCFELLPLLVQPRQASWRRHQQALAWMTAVSIKKKPQDSDCPDWKALLPAPRWRALCLLSAWQGPQL